jgi:hypothetical protein
MQKNHLTFNSKSCPVCGFDFYWRKKWRNNWADVKYCSNKCRNKKRAI